jgi:hypothetical protein
MPDENDIRNLLRLKRFEQPPPDYFDRFLREFQHRQRAELLREPVWKIALHRVQAFFSELAVPQFGYAAATTAVLLMAGMLSMKIISGAGAHSTVAIAQAPGAGSRVALTENRFALDPNIRLTDWNTFPRQQVLPAAQTTAMHPRYVIDVRPVSYEPPTSF